MKSETNRNELHATQKQLDDTQNARDVLSAKLIELSNRMDTANHQLSEFCKERDSLQRTLESLRSEKHHLDKDKFELNLVLETQNADLEKAQTNRNNKQKLYDMLLEEKKMLELDLHGARKDREITEINLRYIHVQSIG